jgi:hypothetical protein
MKDLDTWMNAVAGGQPAGMTAEGYLRNWRHLEDARTKGANGELPAGNETKLLVHNSEILKASPQRRQPKRPKGNGINDSLVRWQSVGLVRPAGVYAVVFWSFSSGVCVGAAVATLLHKINYWALAASLRVGFCLCPNVGKNELYQPCSLEYQL